MLKSLREQAQSWEIKLLLSLIIVTFVMWGGFTKMKGCTAGRVAKINGIVIERDEFEMIAQRKISYLRQQYKTYLNKDLTEADIARYRQMILDQLIDRAVLTHEAEELDVPLSDREVADSIKSEPMFRHEDTGKFDYDRYVRVMKYFRKTPEDYEKERMRDLRLVKFEQLVKDFGKVTDEDVKEDYLVKNEKINLQFIEFDAQKMKSQVKPKESELNDYFEKNKNLYKAKEQRKIGYFGITSNEFKDKIKISEEEISKYLKDNFPNLSGEELKKEKGNAEAKIKDKKLKDMIKEYASSLAVQMPDKTSLSDFVKMKNIKYETSEYVEKGRKIEKIPFSFIMVNNAFNLKKGEIKKDVVLSDGSVYFIELLDIKEPAIPNFSDVKEKVQNDYIASESKTLIKKRADEVLGALKPGVSLLSAASKFGLKVDETGVFGRNERGGNIPKIGTSQELAGKAFALIKPGTFINQVFPISGKYYIVALKEKKNADLKKFEQDKNSLAGTLLSSYQNEIFTRWLKLAKDGSKIKKYVKSGKPGEEDEGSSPYDMGDY